MAWVALAPILSSRREKRFAEASTSSSADPELAIVVLLHSKRSCRGNVTSDANDSCGTVHLSKPERQDGPQRITCQSLMADQKWHRVRPSDDFRVARALPPRHRYSLSLSLLCVDQERQYRSGRGDKQETLAHGPWDKNKHPHPPPPPPGPIDRDRERETRSSCLLHNM
jgi:hypothetical protein